MYKFSERSLNNLKTCDKKLQEIAHLSIKEVDFTIIEGYRTKEKQLEYFKKGLSQTLKSKHCKYPSLAFDFIPYPFVSWYDYESFEKIGKILLKNANKLGYFARRGSDFNINNLNDDKFYDAIHFELLSEEEFKILKGGKSNG